MTNSRDPQASGLPPAGGQPHKPATTSADERGRSAAGVESAREAKDEIVDAAKAKTGELKQDAKDAAEQAKGHIHSAATEQKDAAAGRVDGFAHALKAASDDLHEHGQDFAAAYVQQAADGLNRASGALRERDLDQLIEGVEDFARRQPVAFLGGAVVAGFGLARLMKSSAERRHAGATSQRSRGGAAESVPSHYSPASRPGGAGGGAT